MPLSASVVASYTDKAIDIWQQTATKNKHPDAPRPPDTFLNETPPSVNDMMVVRRFLAVNGSSGHPVLYLGCHRFSTNRVVRFVRRFALSSCRG